MAHVGAIGEVVGAIGPRHQLIEERRLIRRPARTVELGLIGIVQRIEARADASKGLVPADRHEMITVGILA